MQTIERLYRNDQTATPPRILESDQSEIKGTLIMIGGRAEAESLQSVADSLSHDKTLTISTVASKDRENENYQYYKEYFKKLGLSTVHMSSDYFKDPYASQTFSDTSGVFFTGGDQRRIMEEMCPDYYEQLLKFYRDGGVIAGTSAGASVMGEIMPVMQSYALGLGVVPYIIDQHIQRPDRVGRMERLLEQFPERVGVKIPENTALIYQGGKMQVMGEGSVYFLTGQQVVVAENNFLKSHEEVELKEGETADLSLLTLQK